MAPEVILGRRYDGKADIWSLGITILELAYGTVPGSKIKSKDILTRIITEPPPTLDRMGKFSRHMREFVDTCLVKEPDGRRVSKSYAGSGNTDESADRLLGSCWSTVGLKGQKKRIFWLNLFLVTNCLGHVRKQS